MTRNVQSEELLINFAEIQVGDDHLFAVIYRFDNIACVGRDNRAASALQPLTGLILGICLGPKLKRDIARRHHQAHGQNETPRFKRIVPAAQLMEVMYRGPNRDMDMLAGVVQGHAG